MHKNIKDKIINDPIYGLISIKESIIHEIIEHPYFQRLRRISQLGLVNLVYPGANHTRFQHALGTLHLMQKVQANNQFCKFITKNYKSWLHDNNSPLLSNKVFQTKVFPEIEKNKTLYFVLIDNLRYDQWKMISSLVSKDFDVLDDDIYYSILPTSTQYSRNSL